MFKVKYRVGFSFFLLIIFCVFCGRFILLINYFFALYLHEMAHLWVAKKRGYNIDYFDLNIFGFSIKLNNKIKKDDEFIIAVAGPIVNLFMMVLLCALWWIFPSIHAMTIDFFYCNMVLALFNMLPIEPLDGYKMLDGISNKSKKKSKIFNIFINLAFILLFLILFLLNLKYYVNFFYIVIIVFFILNIFKIIKDNSFKIDSLHLKTEKVLKVEQVKVPTDITLYNCFKMLKEDTFTIFILNNLNVRFIDENQLIELLKKYPSTEMLQNCLD